MIDESWQSVVVLCVGLGAMALVGRSVLALLSRRQLAVLAREGLALHRCWTLVDRVPPGLLPQTVRRLLGTIMYLHLERARRVQPDHPFLRSQQTQIGRFIARTLDEPRRVGAASREQAGEALPPLCDLLEESAAEGLISRAELMRAQMELDRMLRRLEAQADRAHAPASGYHDLPAY